MTEIHSSIILKSDSEENWTSNQEKVLQKAEAAIEFLQDGKIKMKVGDGQTSWKNLNYLNPDEIYIGETEPTDPDVKMWIDLSGESGGDSGSSIDLSEYYKLGVGETIPSGADLNDYVTPGVYYASYSILDTLQNCPDIGENGFRLIVQNVSATSVACQTIISDDGAYVFMRCNYIPGSIYRSWRQIAALDSTGKLPAAALPGSAVTSDGTPAGAGSTRDNQLQMGKTLWTGNWSSGTITVPNAGAYNMFVIKTKITSGGAINDTAIIAYAVNYHVRGMGGMSTGNDQSGYNYYFNATVPEYGSESWTLNACTAQGNNSTTIAPQTVTHIIGIC